MPVTTYDEARSIIAEKYSEYYPTFVHEKLIQNHAITLSDETVRKIMSEMGLWKPRIRKEITPPFKLRERRACYGSMIQFDGSYHEWVAGL